MLRRIDHVLKSFRVETTDDDAYDLVDTRNWLPGKKVLLPVRDIGEIQWAESSITVKPTRAVIQAAPCL
jgi:hypothetical protein